MSWSASKTTHIFLLDCSSQYVHKYPWHITSDGLGQLKTYLVYINDLPSGKEYSGYNQLLGQALGVEDPPKTSKGNTYIHIITSQLAQQMELWKQPPGTKSFFSMFFSLFLFNWYCTSYSWSNFSISQIFQFLPFTGRAYIYNVYIVALQRLDLWTAEYTDYIVTLNYTIQPK